MMKRKSFTPSSMMVRLCLLGCRRNRKPKRMEACLLGSEHRPRKTEDGGSVVLDNE